MRWEIPAVELLARVDSRSRARLFAWLPLTGVLLAPVAAGLGVSVEEAAAAVAALSDAGIQGSSAGTGLRRVLSSLESPTSQAVGILGELGLTSEQVRVSQVGLTGALRALAQAGIDTGTALELFGDRGGPAFEVLSSSIPRVVELNAALGDAGGTAARIATVMDQNLNGALLAVRHLGLGAVPGRQRDLPPGADRAVELQQKL